MYVPQLEANSVDEEHQQGQLITKLDAQGSGRIKHIKAAASL